MKTGKMMLSTIAKTSTFHKFLIFIVFGVSLLVTIILIFDASRKEVLRTDSYYSQNIKELGTTMRKCDEASRDDIQLNDIQTANCKTARNLHTEYVAKALYSE